MEGLQQLYFSQKLNVIWLAWKLVFIPPHRNSFLKISRSSANTSNTGNANWLKYQRETHILSKYKIHITAWKCIVTPVSIFPQISLARLVTIILNLSLKQRHLKSLWNVFTYKQLSSPVQYYTNTHRWLGARQSKHSFICIRLRKTLWSARYQGGLVEVRKIP